MVIPAEIRRQLEEHARAEAPNEACGLIAFRDGVAERYLPAVNEEASPYRFRLKPQSPLDYYLEDEGYDIGVFHSHLGAPARPSKTDLENIGQWEGRPYLILSLGTGKLAAFTIRDGTIRELPLTERERAA